MRLGVESPAVLVEPGNELRVVGNSGLVLLSVVFARRLLLFGELVDMASQQAAPPRVMTTTARLIPIALVINFSAASSGFAVQRDTNSSRLL